MMNSDLQAPIIRTRKRRVVSSSKRKKALFSCDRCKTRKIACKRDLESARDPCSACEKAGIECKTTIQRKKKIQGPIENIGLHYKCLLSLLQGLHPELDINNIDELIEFGNKLNIKMPSRSGGYNSEESNELRNIALRLTSGKNPIKAKSSSVEIDYPSPSSTESNTVTSLRRNHPVINQEDKIYYDDSGKLHFIGPFGAPKFLEYSVSCIASKINIDLNKWSSYQNVWNGEKLICSAQDPIDWENIQTKNFPYVQLISRKEADYYVNIFFSKIHYRYLIFNEESFRKSYESFWKVVDEQDVKRSPLAVDQVCSIYLVMMIGKLYKPNQPNNVMQYLDIVRICMSDIVLTSTLDGIRCLMLLAIYMDNTKKRESGYILLELASRQAISMGLHKQIMADMVQDEVEMDDMKRVWWTLMTHEITFSNQFGRMPNICLDEITVEYPQLNDINDVVYKNYYYQAMSINKYLLDALDLRKSWIKNQDILSWTNISKAHKIIETMNQSFEQLDINLSNLLDLTDYKFQLHLKYHYCYLCLTFPYLLYVCNFPDIVIEYVETYQILNQCLESSIKICELCSLAYKSDILSGNVFPDIFSLYHATMLLIIGFIYLLNEGSNQEINFSLQDVKSNIDIINNLLTNYSCQLVGSLRKITRIMDVLIGGFNLIDENRQLFKFNKNSNVLRIDFKNQEFSPKPLDEEHENFFKHFNSLLASDFNLPKSDDLFEPLYFSNPPPMEFPEPDRDFEMKTEKNELIFYDIFN